MPAPSEELSEQQIPLRPEKPKYKKAPKRGVTPNPQPGRGDKEHRYLQNLIKQLAHDRGFRAVIEQEVLGGAGSVDVALTVGTRAIACEISVTTDAKHELGNVGKCLVAGFDEVFVVASDPKHLANLGKSIDEEISKQARERVQLFTPEAFVHHLDGLATDNEPREGMVRGYKVKVSHTTGSKAERDDKRKAIAEVIASSLKRGK